MYERVTGLGWSDVPQSPSPSQWWLGTAPQAKLCLERTGGQQRCFAGSESQIALANGCEQMAESCGGSSVWCCPRGFPEASAAANPGYVAPSHRIPGALLVVGVGVMAAIGWFAFSWIRTQRSVAPAFARYV